MKTAARIAITTIMIVILGLAVASVASASPATCVHAVTPPATVKGKRARPDQRRNLTIALNLAQRMKAPTTHSVAIVAAMTQESSATNLNHGTGSSVGVLQLISAHGKAAWRLVVANSAGWFLRGARKVDPHGRRSPGELAQAVERSAHPGLYHQWVPEARRTLRRYQLSCVRRLV